MSKNLCSVDLPYPEVKVEKPNKYYAELLLDDYSGVVSEFTAVSLYSFQYITAEHLDFESYSELIKCISIVEMTHLDLLAEAIYMLGAVPKYKGTFSTMGQYWNGTIVNYSRNLPEMLNIDILSEVDAIRNYKYHMSLIKDKYIDDLLRRIIIDEEKHVKLFKEELCKIQ